MAKKYALLIGVSEYGEGIPSLSAPPNDVVAMKQVLEDKTMGRFDDITELINPDLVTMQEKIQSLFMDREKNDLVLLYFSGHGITDDNNKLYLTTKGTSKNLFKATAVQGGFIQDVSKESYAKRQVIILDCCYSGAFADGWTAKSVGLDIKKELGAEGRVVLTSSSATQTSFQQENAELSLYTQYFIEGIKTGAADRDGDGKIFARELHNYAKAKVKEVKPNIEPAIILDKEGFNIIISQAPINDPELEFRKLVEKYVSNGEISSYRKEVLKNKQNEFCINNQRAEEIVNSVLEPFRKHLANIADYKKAYQEEVDKQYPNPLPHQLAEDLKDWGQQVLGLSDIEIQKVEQETIAEKKAESIHQESIDPTEVQVRLEQEESKNLHNKPELSEATQAEISTENVSNEPSTYSKAINVFDQLTHLEQLSGSVVSETIKNTVSAVSQQLDKSKKEIYKKRMNHYEQLFFRATRIDISVSDSSRRELKDIQRSLKLSDHDVEKIEQRITAQSIPNKKTWEKYSNKDHNWQCIRTIEGNLGEVNSVIINASETVIVSGGDDKAVNIWDANSGELLASLKGHSGWVTSVSISADNQILVSGSSDKKIRLWNPITGKNLKTLSGHSDWVNTVAISPNKNIIASSSNDKKIKLWRPDTGKIWRTLTGNSEYIRTIATDTNGHILVSSGNNKTIQVWDLIRETVLQTLAGHSGFVRTLALSSDGKVLASGSDDHTIKIWDLIHGNLIRTLTGHANSVRAVSVSDDGSVLVSGSDDHTIKIWDLKTGELLKTLTDHSASVTSVSISANGSLIVSGSNDQTIKVWM